MKCPSIVATVILPSKKDDLRTLADLLESQGPMHTYLQIDVLPGALTSPISGINLAELPLDDAALATKYQKLRVVSYFRLPNKTWQVNSPGADTSHNYIFVHFSNRRTPNAGVSPSYTRGTPNPCLLYTSPSPRD